MNSPADRDRPARGHRTEPAKPVSQQPGEEDARECPDCHATTIGDQPFCGACGYDFVTGVSATPGAGDVTGDVETVTDDGAEDEVPPRPTAWQAGEPHEAYIDPRRDADDIELPTVAAELALDPDDLARRPEVPPPTPPAPDQEHVAHEPAATPPPSRRETSDWVAEVWIDHAWAATRESDQPVPEAAAPHVAPLTATHVVIGRTNLERGLRPDLDAGTDAGVSIRHAQLTSDGHRWWIEDLDTSNGTFVSTVGLPLPEVPIERGQRVRIDQDDRVYLGGWTRLMIRPATVRGG